MPEIAGQKFSKADLGITTEVVCPQCNSTDIEAEPAWKDGEPVGTRVMCRGCGNWSTTLEEDGPEDAAENRRKLEQDLIRVDALIGWLEGFRENAVDELRNISNLDKADQRHLQSEVETLDKLIDFFDQEGDTE
jgi:hypothetical protein